MRHSSALRLILGLLCAVALLGATALAEDKKTDPAKTDAKAAAKPTKANKAPAATAKTTAAPSTEPAKPAAPPPPPPPATPVAAPFAQPPAAAPAVEDLGAKLPKDTVVLTIGERKFTVADFEKFLEMIPARQRAMINVNSRRSMAENLANMLVLSDEARRRKLDEDPAVKSRLWAAQEQTLAQSLVQKVTESIAITPEEIQAYYDQNKSRYEEVRVSHILIRAKGGPGAVPEGKKELTDEEAKAKADEVYKQVTTPGADFAAIATAESYDKGSAVKGGDLGYITRGRMVPDFEKAAFELGVGEIGTPVKSPFGWHIIKVVDKKNKSMADVRTEIENALKSEKQRQAMDTIQKGTKVEYNDVYFPKIAQPQGGFPSSPGPRGPAAGVPGMSAPPVRVAPAPAPAPQK